MKKLAWFVSTLLIFCYQIFTPPLTLAQSSSDTLIRLGMNWMPLQDSAVVATFNNIFKCNLYHASNVANDSANMAMSGVNLIYEDANAISRYSGGQMFIYQAVSKPKTSDTAQNNYFLCRHTAYGDAAISVGDTNYWRIDSSSHSLDTVLWRPEFAGSWNSRYTPDSLRLAVRLHVLIPAADSADSAENVISIVVKEIDTAGGAGYNTVLYTLNIPWKNCATNDKVFIDTDIIKAPDLLGLPEDGLDSVINGYQIYVCTNRYVTTFLDYVALMNVYADTLLRGFDLVTSPSYVPPNANYTYAGDTMKYHIADSLIWNDSLQIHNHFGSASSKILYFYEQDEPTLTSFAAQGRVNALLNHRGAVERWGGQALRYIRQVQPKVLWAGFNATEYQVSSFIDTASFDSCYESSDHAYHCYTIAALRKYKANQYGYLNSPGETKQEHSLFTESSHGSADTYDDFDLKRGAFITVKENGDYIGSKWLDQEMFLDPSRDSTFPHEWWANIFINGGIAMDTGNQGGYYKGGPASLPEEVSCVSHSALAMGATGLLYFTPVAYDSADSKWPHNQIYTGFLDTNHLYSYNSDICQGDTIPTWYKNRSQWLISFSNWLNIYAKELKGKQWQGSFIRQTYEFDSAGVFKRVQVDTETLGKNILINAGKDSSTRNMIKEWPNDSTSHPLISSGDTILKEVDVSQQNIMVNYGFFHDTVVAKQGKTVYYLYAVNDYCDPRDVLCRFIDTTSNYIKRGERTIWTTFTLDSTTSHWWNITTLDSTNTDTVIAYDGQLREHFLPGEGKIFKITPLYEAHIGTGDIPFNNGRRAEWDSSANIYRFVYSRNDSVFYRQTTTSAPITWTPEYCLAGGASADTFGHPSLRMLQDATRNLYSTGVAYEMADSVNYYVYLRTNEFDTNSAWDAPILISQFSKDSEEFVPAPVLAPNVRDTGFVVAWSANIGGIGLRAVDLHARPMGDTTTTPTLSLSTVVSAFSHHYNYGANILDRAAGFPSIVEDSGTSGFGLVFQQERSGYASQIFFTTGNTSYGSGVPTISVNTSPDWVSRVYSADCPNAHPCLDRSHSRNSAAANVFLRSGGSPTVFSGWVPGVTPGASPAYFPWYWNIAWDAPQVLFQLKQGCTVETQNVTWETMDDMRDGLPTQNWVYNLFAPQGDCNDNKYSYPSIRSYDGKDSLSSLPATIGWQTVENTVLFARSPSAYPPALPANPNTFIIAPLQESGITETAILTPTSATTPNLEMTGRDNSWYGNQRAFYKDLRMPDLRVLANPIAAMDTAGSWMWKGNVFYQLKDTNVTSCIQTQFWISFVGSSGNDSTPSLNSRVQFTTLKTPQDSTAIKTGLIAVSDTVHIGNADSVLNIRRTCYSPDTTSFATAIGGGEARFYIEVASYATGATLLSVDSLIEKVSNLGFHDATLDVNLTSLKDSAVFFRFRVVDTSTPILKGVAAQAYRVMDTNAPSGFAKTISPYPNVPASDNPIGLTIFPNPAKGNASVLFSIPVEDADDVTQVNIYDALGRDVTMLLHDIKPAGMHIVQFDGSGLPSGRYMVAVKTANHAQSKLMILEK